MAPTPARVRVTGPRRPRSRPRTIAAEIDAHSEVGAAYLRSLMRAQFGLALRCLALLGFSVGLLPVFFLTIPWLRRASVMGLPLPWLILGLLVYPVLLAIGWWYVRQAERNELRFLREVEGSTRREASSP